MNSAAPRVLCAGAGVEVSCQLTKFVGIYVKIKKVNFRGSLK